MAPEAGFLRALLLGVLVLFLLLPAIAAGQEEVRFDRIGLREGLTKGAIYGIAQDLKGYMWFATTNGLYRYEGYSFTVFRNDPDDPSSLSDNFVTDVCADGEGRVWVGTESGNMDRFEPATGTFVHFRLPSDGSGADRAVKHIYLDGEGDLWVITLGGALLYLDSSHRKFIRYESGPSDDFYIQDHRILRIFEDSKGYLWLSVEDSGLVRTKKTSRESALIGVGGNSRPVAAELGNSVLYEDHLNRLWVGTWGGGLFLYDPERDSFRPISDVFNDACLAEARYIKCFLQDGSGCIWIGTADAGLLKFDTSKEHFSLYRCDPTDQHSLSSDIVEVLYKDKSDTIWIGTLSGLNKYSKYKYKFRYYSSRTHGEQSSTPDYIFSILKDSSGSLWLGTIRGKAIRIDVAGGSRTTFDLSGGGVENAVYSFCEDSTGDLLAGTSDRGLFRLDKASDSFVSITRPQQISDIHEDREGVLWIATHVYGVGMFDRSKGEFSYWIPRSSEAGILQSFDASVIYEDASGNLWIGSDGQGLVRLFPDRKRYTHYRRSARDSNSISDDRILSILEDEEGILWVGTRNGLNRLDTKTGVNRKYFEKDILPDNTIYGVLPGGRGDLWISTNKGLGRFDPRTEMCRTYDLHSGILEYEFNAGAFFRSTEGELFFGGGSECIAFFPGELEDNPHQPNIVVTSFSKLGREVAFSRPVDQISEVVLPYYENIFSVGFAALDFAETDQNAYSYKLEGFNDEWIPCGSRDSAGFVQVPPGDYVFQVKGSNSDGVWSAEAASLRIVVVPPFWMTMEFRVLMIAAGAASVIAIYKLRTTSIKRQRNILQKEVDERREAERMLLENQARLRSLASELTLTEEHERRRIAVSLHDRIGHALLLTKLKLKAQTERAGAGGEPGEFFKEMLDLVDGIIDDAHSLTVEISPPVLYQFGFEAAAENLVERFGEEYRIKTAISVNGRSPISDDVSILLYQALRELLVNVVKHADADLVKVTIRHDGSRIYVTVRDNGSGLDSESVLLGGEGAKGFGLFSIRERLEPLGGSLSISSVRGRGTEVAMTAPLSRESKGSANEHQHRSG